MPRNVEVKAKIKDFSRAIDIARDISGTDAKIILQEDTFFNVPEGRLKLRNFPDGTSSELIYYNRPDLETPKTSDYTICSIEGKQDLLHVLKSALGVKGTVKKTRYLFLYKQTRIHIDQVEGLGNFLELEVVLGSNESVEEAQEVAKSLTQKFNITNKDLVKGAYIDLLLQK